MRLSPQLGFASVILLTALTACNSPGSNNVSNSSTDGGTASDAGQTADANGPVVSPEVGRIVLSHRVLLLAQVDASATLEATVYNIDGVELADAELTWTTSQDQVATVEGGVVSAAGRWGSAQIQAVSGDVRSAPLLILVADPADNAVLIDDDKVGAVTAVDPEAELDIGWQYRVELTGLDEAPTPGTLLISTGEAGISGRVVSVDASSTPNVATMEAVAPSALFDAIEIKEQFETQHLDYQINDALAEYFEVIEPQAGWVRLAPRPHLLSLSQATELIGNFAGAMNCKKSVGLAPVLELTGFQVDAKIDDLRLDVDWSGGQLRKLMVVGQLQSDIRFPVNVNAAFEGEIKCKTQLIKFPIAIGPLGPLFGPAIEIGGGLALKGRSTLADFSFEPYSRSTADLGFGYRCDQGGNCGMASDFEHNMESGINYGPSGLWANDPAPMLEGEAKAFAYADLTLGARFIGMPRNLEFPVIQIEGGGKADVTLMSLDRQVSDATRSSHGKVSAYLEAGIPLPFGDKLRDWFNVSLTIANYNWDLVLARSPVGTAEQVTEQFPLVAYQPVELQINLTPPHHEFLGNYNVREIVVYHYDSTKPVANRFTEISRVAANEGQTEFTIEWEPTTPQLQAREDENGNDVLPWLHVFYVPRISLIEGLELELGPNSRIGLGPGLSWTADVPVRSGAQVGSLISFTGAIDDAGRLGFCGTKANGDQAAFIWNPQGGVVDMTGGRFTSRRFSGCFIGNGTGLAAIDNGAGFNLLRDWQQPGEITNLGFGEGFREHRPYEFGAAIAWGNRNSNGDILFYSLDHSDGFDPHSGWDVAILRIFRNGQFLTVAEQRGSFMLRPLMSDEGEVVWRDNNGVVRLSSGRRLGNGDAGLSPGISDRGGRVAWVEDGSLWLTSAADQWLPIRLVNPTDNELVGSIETDQRVGVGFAEGSSGRSAFAVFVGTNANGQATLFVAQIPEGTTNPEQVAVVPLATAGEAIAGITPREFSLYDPVSPDGHIVAKVSTAGGDALIRFMKN